MSFLTYIDTHAHVFGPEFDLDRGQMLARAQEAGVSQLFMPNLDHHSLASMLQVEEEYPWCHALLGLHPSYVKSDFREVLAQLEKAWEQREFKGIGEAGIDLYWDTTFAEEQKEALRIQCGWARERQVPIVLHTRNAFAETLAIVREMQDGRLKGIFHCFSGSVEEARAAVDQNFLLGIGGVGTFKNGGLEPVIQQTDLPYLVLETDSPYLAPVPHRGKRNEPSFLPLVAQRIAEIKSLTLAEIARETSANALRLFS